MWFGGIFYDIYIEDPPPPTKKGMLHRVSWVQTKGRGARIWLVPRAVAEKGKRGKDVKSFGSGG